MNIAARLFLAAVTIGAPVLLAEETAPAPQPEHPVNVNADNTKRNERERNSAEKNPVDQKENKSDLEISRQIRKLVVDDKQLSTNAHNVKIITQDGVVNLKGPVESVVEKENIEKKAVEVAGKGKVESQLEVTTQKSK